MKYRNGFVSNSSSSSFVISKSVLTPMQLELIHGHIEVGRRLDIEWIREENEWTITETDTEIRGHTIIDNFDMSEFLEKIDVDPVHIQWDDY